MKTRAPTEEEIIAHMNGNLCRCTGYLPILKAIRQAGAELRGEPPKNGDGAKP